MKQQILWAMLTCLLFITTTYGQGWEQFYSKDTLPIVSGLDATTDGGFIVAGTYYTNTPPWGRPNCVIKTDANGDTLWTKEYQGPNQNLAGIDAIKQTLDGGFIFVGSVNSNPSDILCVKTNAWGDTLWTKTISTGVVEKAHDIEETSNGGYILVGYKNSGVNSDAYLVKLDVNGDTLWTKTYGGANGDEGQEVKETADGGYILTGKTRSYGAGSDDVYLIKTNVTGDTLWTRVFGGTDIDEGYSVEQTADGGYILTGSTRSYGAGWTDIYLIKTNATGDTLWTKVFGGSSLDESHFVGQTADGGYFITGTSGNFGLGQYDLYGIKTDANGNILWTKTFGRSSDTYYGEGLGVIMNNGFGVVGSRYSTTFGKEYMHLIKTDTLGNIYSNYIKGNVYNDLNFNCTKEVGDHDLGNIVVRAIGNETWYGTTDSVGSYCIPVDTGSYTVVVDHSSYWQPCANSVPVVFSTFYANDTINFPLQAQINCPLMQVDLSAPFLRSNGFGSNYTVSYCNVGTVDEANVSIDVTLDPDLNVLGTSIPIANQINNVLSFNIGNVAYGDCGSFTIQVQVGQNVVLGKTHCSEAHIYPDSICLPNWTGPIIKPKVVCLPDSVRFTLENVGASVFNSANYSIVEDHFIMNIGPTGNIPSSGSVDVTIFADTGKTYRIEVPQDPNYPSYLGDSIASIAVEGCKPYFNGLFNTGFVTQFSNGNSSPFIAVDCQQNIGSYDPNDKSAQPKGYDSQHYIYDYTDLDYKIRFQNTGTDTAFLVVLRDTISEHLDLTTLTMGASSHSYTWRIYNNRVLEVTFQNIMLPDSNVNEPASNGFVRYRIEQKGGNPTGTIIYNSADIYFDFNAPIKTNETWHTIGEDFILLNVISDKLLDQSVEIKVYPNPFTHHTTIEVAGKSYGELELAIFDVMGRRVRTEQAFSDHKIQLTKENLTPGIYLYELQGDKKLLNTGKIIVQ